MNGSKEITTYIVYHMEDLNSREEDPTERFLGLWEKWMVFKRTKKYMENYVKVQIPGGGGGGVGCGSS